MTSPHLRDRINRRLDALTDERLYQVLDYVEFLESKYAKPEAVQTNPLQRFAEGVEDTLRAGKVSTVAIAETMGLLNKAVGVLNGVAAAGKSVATDLANAASRATATTPAPGAQPGQPAAPGAEQRPAQPAPPTSPTGESRP